LWQKRFTEARIWSAGLVILVVPIDEGADIGFELSDRGMNTWTEPLWRVTMTSLAHTSSFLEFR
jgi:hypothetical protein